MDYSKSSKRIYSIDFLKVVATLFVIRLHSGIGSYCPAYTYYLAGCAVPLFFMTNGAFVLNRKPMTWSYAYLKIIKLFRIILLWSLIYVIAYFLYKNTYLNIVCFIFDSLLQKAALGNFWFLGALILIYLILPILHQIFNCQQHSPLVLAIGLGGICVLFDLVSVILFKNGHATIAKMVPQICRLWTWLFYFCLGGALFKYREILIRKITFRKGSLILLALSIISGPLQYILVNRWYRYYSPEYAFDNIVIILWNTMIMIWCLLLPENKIISVIAKLEPYSMGIYVVHSVLILGLSMLNLFNYAIWYINVPVLFITSLTITYIAIKIPFGKKFVTL